MFYSTFCFSLIPCFTFPVCLLPGSLVWHTDLSLFFIFYYFCSHFVSNCLYCDYCTLLPVPHLHPWVTVHQPSPPAAATKSSTKLPNALAQQPSSHPWVGPSPGSWTSLAINEGVTSTGAMPKGHRSQNATLDSKQGIGHWRGTNRSWPRTLKGSQWHVILMDHSL